MPLGGFAARQQVRRPLACMCLPAMHPGYVVSCPHSVTGTLPGLRLRGSVSSWPGTGPSKAVHPPTPRSASRDAPSPAVPAPSASSQDLLAILCPCFPHSVLCPEVVSQSHNFCQWLPSRYYVPNKRPGIYHWESQGLSAVSKLSREQQFGLCIKWQMMRQKNKFQMNLKNKKEKNDFTCFLPPERS